MGHCLKAIIGREQDIKSLAKDWLHAECLALAQGFWLISLTDELLDDINELINCPDTDPYTEFCYFSASLSALLETKSHLTALAYIETDYFGGIGSQAAILYEKGKVRIKPLKTDDLWDHQQQLCVQAPTGMRAINTVLKAMGVVCVQRELDEFDTLKLGWQR